MARQSSWSTINRPTAWRWPNSTGNSGPGSKGLVFLHIDFQQGFDGGWQQRQVTFREQVRATFGPVRDWNERLQIQNDGQLRPNMAHMQCRQLSVYQLPGRASENSFEMLAEGNTMVEGRAETGQI